MVLVAAACAAILITQNSPSDACTNKDREQNNCVHAGQCTPPGDANEAVTDCAVKNYDHKFNSAR